MTTRVPLSSLRFVERQVEGRKTRILQQLIGFANGTPAEWEDVPVFIEAPALIPLPVVDPSMLEGK